MNREELLDTIRRTRSEFDSALAGLSVAQMLQPVLPGGWSVKDALAHIGWWEQRGADLFRTFAAGQQPAEVINDENLDAVNERIYQQYKDDPFDEVRAFEQSAYRDILLLVETVPEEDLFDPNRFPELGHQAVDLIIFNTSDHYIEHLETMRGKF